MFEPEIASEEGLLPKYECPPRILQFLPEGTTARNFLAMLAITFLFGIMSSNIDLKFSDNINERSLSLPEIVTVYHFLHFRIPLVILLAPLYGVLSDFAGRKFALVVGMLILIVTVIIQHFSGAINTIALLTAISTAVIEMLIRTPFVADFVHNSTKGIMSGAFLLLVFAGTFLSNLIYGLLTTNTISKYIRPSDGLNLIGILTISGIGSLIFKFLNDTRYQDRENGQNAYEEPSFLRKTIQGFTSSLNSWIFLSFLCSFIIGAHSSNSTAVLSNWLAQFIGVSTPSLYSLFGIMKAAQIVLIIIGSFLIDRVSNYLLLLSGVGLHIIGLITIISVQDPNSGLLTFSLLLQGAGVGILSLMELFLIARYSPAGHRGKLFGLNLSIIYLGSITSEVLGNICKNPNLTYFIRFIIEAGIMVLIFFFYRARNRRNQELVKQQHEPTLVLAQQH